MSMFSKKQKQVEEKRALSLRSNGRYNRKQIMKLAWAKAKNLAKLFSHLGAKAHDFISETLLSVWAEAKAI